MVHETLRITQAQVVCLQETKLQQIDSALASFLGAYRFDKFFYKPARGTNGGILMLWKDSFVELQNCKIGRYSVSADATIRHCATSFKLTTVYGPSHAAEKEIFMRHIRNLKPADDTKWLLLGDFNLMYEARDKNNNNLNLRLIRQFRNTINRCELKEIHLQNRKYTWSNERRYPTLVRLDRVFCNQSWGLHFENHALHALSSSHSDHCPLLLYKQEGPRRPTPFRFENI
ncbi:hypothetical protein HU200_007942 [Digitaria exilis]|uniref:Endonuclease/exonuclease/phosphatase domain-containing protein n=1 Tax=Digitaria exilis TaxID=1010633 RepID=A0A835KU30_9POAL|nr:hypothetical protein HU200_007942 [Digitaria exilis]